MTVDKSKFLSGPWTEEPDHVSFFSSGMFCRVDRMFGGHLCGYVAIPEGHPLHGVGLSDLRFAAPGLKVHGGVSFAGKGFGDVWWIGFDCDHAWDARPPLKNNDGRVWLGGDGIYRDLAYVREETERLARQIAARAKPDPRDAEIERLRAVVAKAKELTATTKSGDAFEAWKLLVAEVGE